MEHGDTRCVKESRALLYLYSLGRTVLGTATDALESSTVALESLETPSALGDLDGDWRVAGHAILRAVGAGQLHQENAVEVARPPRVCSQRVELGVLVDLERLPRALATRVVHERQLDGVARSVGEDQSDGRAATGRREALRRRRAPSAASCSSQLGSPVGGWHIAPRPSASPCNTHHRRTRRRTSTTSRRRRGRRHGGGVCAGTGTV